MTGEEYLVTICVLIFIAYICALKGKRP